MIRVVLVDDQTLVRQGIQTLIELEDDICVVGTASDGREALAVVATQRPDVVLMDIRMPHMDGVAATRALLAEQPSLGVIILTTFDDDEYVFAGLRAGARGYMLKDTNADEIVAAVRTVAAGEALIQPSITRKVVAEFSRLANERPTPVVTPLLEALTEREHDVLRAIALGHSNREIANQLMITEGTVKNHVSNLLAKLEVRDRTQAVLRAQQLGLLG
ncbi:response regulator [Candidatus Viridilinea mediisalina]|uniref:DNA-binding response regulator n=1 Tax=Candidatus Viridilinea mediisalina TaxID=2024553 RepID=A0A2A6RK29_9CHLR|nr:response regulator transcription factor [Candidatus Viridilinea mediisalina]PDW03265.1 DNA-binding response regulator [Candidatus Viridilinea mediisalina]